MSPLLIALLSLSLTAVLASLIWLAWRARRSGGSQSDPGKAQAARQRDWAFDLAAHLLDAPDADAALRLALKALAEAVEARGATFLPFDEWRPALSPVTFGQVPAEAANSLTSPLARQACKLCEARQAGPECVMLQEDAGLRAVRCLSLRAGGRPAGMVNLYFPGPRTLSVDDHHLLAGIVMVCERALDGLHARERERAALGYFGAARGRRDDLPAMLDRLLESLHEAIGIEFGLVWVPEADGPQPGAWVQEVWPNHGDPVPRISDAFLRELWGGTERSGRVDRLERVDTGSGRVWPLVLSVPLVRAGEPPVGLLLLGFPQDREFGQPQIALLQTVAGQTALLVQTQRALGRVEYRAVVDERSRLAREIHDGLAQTLAFMKMETARMQAQLAAGDLDALAGRLRGLSETLADAYLDARQSIDALRQVPQSCFAEWLQNTAADFRTATGLRVTVDVQTPARPLAPEISAQAARIVQEALSNIRKHSAAAGVTVTARSDGADYTIEIGDDGRGFTPQQAEDRMQYGLRGMRERADQIGAEFQVISRPGQGTTIRLGLPGMVREVR